MTTSARRDAAWPNGPAVVPSPFHSGTSLEIFDLSMPLYPGVAHHPNAPGFEFELLRMHGDVRYADGATSCAERFTTGGHVGTHIDAVGHIARDGIVHDARSVVGAHDLAGGLAVGSVEEIPPLINRAHVVDAVAMLGRRLTPADVVDAALFEAWFSRHGAPAPGAVVLVRTGWASKADAPEEYLGTATGLPGVDLSGAKWLTDHGVIATGSDTLVYEHVVAGRGAIPVHLHLLVDHGVFILEGLNLEDLAPAVGGKSFVFIALPLRIRGGTGSPVRPVALVAPADAGLPTSRP